MVQQASWEMAAGRPATAVRYMDQASAVPDVDITEVLVLRGRANVKMSRYSNDEQVYTILV